MSTIKKKFISIVGFAYRFGLRHFGGMGLQRVWPFGQVRTWMDARLKVHDWPESYNIDGHIFYPPESMRMSFAQFMGKREELEFRLFEREISKGGTVIDVGANIGYYCLPFARAVGPRGKVFAFEPEPVNLAFLRKNVEANGYKNVTVVPKAVGERSGTTPLFISDYNVGGHQIWDIRARINSHSQITEDEKAMLADEHSDTPRRSIEVGLTSLDDFFCDWRNPINFVKIDVEGAEGGVFSGMKNILKKNKDLKLHFEFTPAMIRLFGADPDEILKKLEGYGFKFYSLAHYKKWVNEVIHLTRRELMLRCTGNKTEEVFAKRG